MTVETITFGCRLNAHESDMAKAHAMEAGLRDTVIVNTCAVTSEAVRQAGQAIRKARRDKPEATIIVTGCAAQIEPSRFAAMPEVDHVIGNGEKTQPTTYASLSAGGFARVKVNDIASVRETAGHAVRGFGSRARAFVEVQNGCDHRCTFCIIPYGRGPSRSVPAGEVVSTIRGLVEQGCPEVVLTGVDLTSYGSDLPGQQTLGTLVRSILRLVPELKRLRISSIDTIEADPVLIEAIATEDRLMPHLHLSLQSGDNLILKRMKRRHAREDAIRFCTDMKALRPDMTFGADLIAGFPTETRDMFANTLRLVEECGLTFLHVFPYSPRPGTPAARMPQVAKAETKERAARLRETGRVRMQQHLAGCVGRTVDVLMEEGERGRAPFFTEVKVTGMASPGPLVRVSVDGHDGKALLGRVAA
jgi:threonylcarbamoyladenosine tRNA methylthiotransferase MtaB